MCPVELIIFKFWFKFEYFGLKESPSISILWDECTTLSRIASATVLFCKYPYQSLTGSCEVIIVELIDLLVSIISNKFVASSTEIGDTPKSSKIKSLYLANLLLNLYNYHLFLKV